MNRQRGSAAAFALVIALALGVVLTVALRARSTGLSFEQRSLDRTCARWSAESGLAHLLAELAAGRRPDRLTGKISATEQHSAIDYQVVVRSTGARLEVSIEGTCVPASGERAAVSRLEVTLGKKKGRHRVERWREPAGP